MSDELIRRGDVLDLLNDLVNDFGDNYELYSILFDSVDEMKSVQPKTGRWIDITVGDVPAQACDQCKTFYPLTYTGGKHHYCPNCGAKMEGDKNNE